MGFLSAVADRFGLWSEKFSAWGNWSNFIAYTAQINPWFSDSIVQVAGVVATIAEVAFAIFLLIGFKTELVARLSGILLLLFALAMTFSVGIKSPLDYSVFSASAAAFGLSQLKEKSFELDAVIQKKNT